MTLQLGDTAPDFTAETTEGSISFHDWIERYCPMDPSPCSPRIAIP